MSFYIYETTIETKGEVEMEKCPNCDEWLVGCPCCATVFCPECGETESDLEEGDSDD